MLRFCIKIFNLFLNFIYLFFKLCPRRNKVFLLSRQSDEPSMDYRMLIDEIREKYPDIEIACMTKRVTKSVKDVLLKNIPLMLKQMYHLATSKAVIVDGYNITVSVLKHKKGLKVFQAWHALCAIKKFGFQCLESEKKKAVSDALKMHQGYDYINVAGRESIPHFAKAFNYPESKFRILGLPRIDYLIKSQDENRDRVYAKYPEFKEKEVIMYAPTFRDNDHYEIDELIDAVDKEKYIFIVKVHPNMKYEIKNSEGVYFCPEFSTLELMASVDFVITDYSAISLEAAILNRKILIYAYDLEEYTEMTGMNIDIEKEFGKYVFKNPKELFASLDSGSYDRSVVTKYCDRYVEYRDGKVTERLVKFIVEGEN